MAVRQATDASFSELIREGVCVVDFYSTHCGPCRLLLPKLMNLEAEFPFIQLIKVNTDECPGLATEYKIYTLPTVYLCKDGRMDEYKGALDPESLRQAVGKLLYE